MSMTSAQAEEQICPLSKDGLGHCDGWCCPRWVVERLPSGAICCSKTEEQTGAEFIPEVQDKRSFQIDIMKCRLDHDITNCRECPNAYGHCAG